MIVCLVSNRTLPLLNIVPVTLDPVETGLPVEEAWSVGIFRFEPLYATYYMLSLSDATYEIPSLMGRFPGVKVVL